MANQEVAIADECGIGANCYYCIGTETTCYTPSGLPEFCGMMFSEYNGLFCTRRNGAMCIMPGHQAYADLSDGNEKTYCIILQQQENCVKPMWLDGTEAIFKSVQKGGCTTSRCSFPMDDDAPGRCAVCCCYLGCEEASGCCPKIPGLAPQSFTGAGGKGYETDYKKPNTGVEYLCCAVPCNAFSLYIPEYMTDAFGCETEYTMCCVQASQVAEVFPEEDGPEHEVIYLKKRTKMLCVQPETILSYKARLGFTFCKAAIPPTEEAPCALAICGMEVCGAGEKYQNIYMGRKVKPRAGGMASQEETVDAEKMDRA
jgi:hypothetical protein